MATDSPLPDTDINPMAMMQATQNTKTLDDFDQTAEENNDYEVSPPIDIDDVMQIAKIAML